jgi:hypothetical protein
MQITYSLHPDLYLADDTVEGLERKGLIASELLTGEPQVRDYSDKSRATFGVNLIELNASTNRLAMLEAFFDQTAMGLNPFWLHVPISRQRRQMYCGSVGDASETIFPCPIRAPSGLMVEVAGALKTLTTDYAFANYANLVHDEQASPERGTTTKITGSTSPNVTVSVVYGIAKWGIACYKVDPDASAANHYIECEQATYYAPVDANEDYKGGSYVRTLATENVRALILWYTGAGAYISTSTGSNVGCAADTWQWVDVDATAPGTAARAKVKIERTATSANDFYVDCFGCIPFQADRWWFPDTAPALIEMASAPAAGERVVAAGSGELSLPVRLDRSSTAWRLMELGHAEIAGFEATEVVE